MRCLVFLFLFFISCPSFSQWSQINSGSTEFIWSIFFTSADTGYTADDFAVVRKTTNGGSSWTWITATSGRQVYFPNSDTGFAFGLDKIRKTSDAGSTWNIVFTDPAITFPDWTITGLDCPTPTIFYAIATSIYDTVKIIKSTDAGDTWNIISSNVTYTATNPRISFSSQDTGYYFTDKSIEKTTDAGNNWTEIYSDIINPIIFSDIKFFGLTGFVLDNNGFLLKTINSGTNWNSIFVGSGGVQYDFHFIDADTGYIAGGNANGFVLRTTNSAVNWAPDTTSASVLSSVFFLNSGYGFAGGMGGTLLKYSITDTSQIMQDVKNSKSRSLKEIKIFPTPFMDEINITGFVPITEISIFNVLGETVYSIFDLTNKNTDLITKIQTKDWQPGTYFVRLVTGTNISISKIIKTM